ncbi:MFS transporter [Saccharothrix xinjiangensis]|uniref:MFS transporter n=1 Tax=Saccharothrix xinjiangensis TaxID=204798 RepID=A0ABV9Y480_9PSEU
MDDRRHNETGGRFKYAFAALRIPNFRFYLTGQSVACTGIWMQVMALDWLVLELTGSPTAVGLTMAAQSLPVLFLGAAGGIVADRYSKRVVLIATQSACVVLNFAMASLSVSGHVRIQHVYVFAVALGMVFVVDNPARQVFTGEMVPMWCIRGAIALNSAVFHGSRLIGPIAAAMLIHTEGMGWVFAVSAACHLFSLLVLTLIRSGDPVTDQAAAAGPILVRSVLRDVVAEPRVVWTLFLVAVIGTFGLKFPVVLAAMADSTFDGGAQLYGLFNVALAAGSVVGAILGGRCARTRLRVVVVLAVVFGCTQAIAAVVPALEVFLIALIALGASNLAFQTVANSSLQVWTRPEVRGRVMGLYMLALIGGAPLGGPAVGWVCTLFGPRTGMVVCGVVPLAAAALVGASLHRPEPRWHSPRRERRRLFRSG